MNEKELTQSGLSSLSENELTALDGGLLFPIREALAFVAAFAAAWESGGPYPQMN